MGRTLGVTMPKKDWVRYCHMHCRVVRVLSLLGVLSFTGMTLIAIILPIGIASSLSYAALGHALPVDFQQFNWFTVK